MHVSKNSLVVQSNKLVEAKYRLSVEEQKIIKILVSQIQKDDKDFKDYEFRIKDLAELLGMEHTNIYGVLRGITRRLVSRVLEFYDSDKKEFIQASWLSGAKYKEGHGTVTLHFDPLLKPLLLQLQSYFTKYELGQVLRFKGQYTIRFFEFRKSFQGRNIKEMTIDLKKLREILGLTKTEYKDFSNFKARVLEPARLELSEKVGQSFSWEPIRQGRGGKITALRFKFEGNATEDDQERAVIAVPETTRAAEHDVQGGNLQRAVNRLLKIGVSSGVAYELARTYGEPYITEKIAIVEAHPEYVKNAAGFVITAIQEDWKDPELEERKRNNRRRLEQNAKQEHETMLRAIKQDFEMHSKSHILQQYEQLPTDVREAYRAEFLETLNSVLLRRYAKKKEFGFDDPYFRAFITQHKADKLSLEDYLGIAGLSLSPEDILAIHAL